jgi:hypothetical protein
MFKEIKLGSKTDKRGLIRTKVRSVGINDAPYYTSYLVNGKSYTCPYFIRWRTMLDRCYSKTWLKKHPTYLGCSVDPRWHHFTHFRAWMEKQQWQDRQLDKDILVPGNKVYSPETCIFISPTLNSFFNIQQGSNTLPTGIYERNGKFEVGISYGNSKRKWVGAYNSVPEAVDAYLAAKAVALNYVLKKETNPIVVAAAKNYYNYLADKLCSLKAGY